MMRTTTLFPLRLLVTFTFVPNGRLRCAAVMADGFIRSPDAVREVSAYHEARPHWLAADEGLERKVKDRVMVAPRARSLVVRIVWGVLQR